MAFDESLAARIRQSLARRKTVKDKKMFGGIIFLLNGKWIQRALKFVRNLPVK